MLISVGVYRGSRTSLIERLEHVRNLRISLLWILYIWFWRWARMPGSALISCAATVPTVRTVPSGMLWPVRSLTARASVPRSVLTLADLRGSLCKTPRFQTLVQHDTVSNRVERSSYCQWNSATVLGSIPASSDAELNLRGGKWSIVKKN